MPNSIEQKTYGLFSTPINRKLIRELEDKGATVFQFPPIETKLVKPDGTSNKYLQNLPYFDWIIFTDVWTVDYFLQTLENREIDFFELDNLSVCVFGEAVADRLRFVQLHADLIPNSVETNAVFTSILNFSSRTNLDNLQILVVQESGAKVELSAKLTENKAVVSELSVYQAMISNKKMLARLKTLLQNGAIDEFIFSSPEDLISLKYIFAGNTLSEILTETNISAADQAAYQALKENNLQPIFHILKK